MKPFSAILISFNIIVITLSSTALSDEFSPDSIIGITKRVASYHMKAGPIYPNTWDGGAYLTGIMAMYRITKDPAYLTYATQWAVKFAWLPAITPLTTLADDICCFQTYCEIYLCNPKPENDSMIAKVRANLENLFYVVKTPQPHTLWSWDDALYMAPPAVSRYSRAINNNAFIDTLDRYWWDVSGFLYDTSYHLWYRDGGFKTQKAANGQPVFWSCGVAWVYGGMTRVLQDIPLTHPARSKWLTQFGNMAAAIKAEQGMNNTQYSGLWTTSMRDHTQWPDPESSASAFFCFGMAWGINNHVLDSAQYIGCARTAWRDLVANVGTDGSLQRCEDVSDQPASINVGHSSFEGEGAFMLAGEEMWKMATHATVSVKRNIRDVHSESGMSRPLFVAIGQSAAVAVPPRARRASLFDASGRCVWMRDVTNESRIRVPVLLGENRLLMIRFGF
jgi:rhamnogalacturonyl hydrolase YesR